MAHLSVLENMAGMAHEFIIEWTAIVETAMTHSEILML
jgi:hypothetical protein